MDENLDALSLALLHTVLALRSQPSAVSGLGSILTITRFSPLIVHLPPSRESMGAAPGPVNETPDDCSPCRSARRASAARITRQIQPGARVARGGRGMTNVVHAVNRPRRRLPAATIVEPRHTIFEPKRPIVEPRHTIFEPRHTIVGPRHAIVGPRHAIVGPRHTIAEPKHSIFEPRHTIVEPRRPIVEPRHTIAEPRRPIVEPRHTIVEPRRPIVEPRHTIAEPRHTIVEPRHTIVEPRHTIAEPRHPHSPWLTGDSRRPFLTRFARCERRTGGGRIHAPARGDARRRSRGEHDANEIRGEERREMVTRCAGDAPSGGAAHGARRPGGQRRAAVRPGGHEPLQRGIRHDERDGARGEPREARRHGRCAPGAEHQHAGRRRPGRPRKRVPAPGLRVPHGVPPLRVSQGGARARGEPSPRPAGFSRCERPSGAGRALHGAPARGDTRPDDYPGARLPRVDCRAVKASLVRRGRGASPPPARGTRRPRTCRARPAAAAPRTRRRSTRAPPDP